MIKEPDLGPAAKFRINDIATYEFLKQFCSNIGLNGLYLGYIKQELDAIGASASASDRLIAILHKLQSQIDTGQLKLSSPESGQALYTELMTALTDETIVLDARITTHNLNAIYRALFDNDLDLTQIMAQHLGVRKFYTDSGERSWSQSDCVNRFRRLLGQNTLGIHSETGSKHSFYGFSHPESSYDKLVNGVIGYNYFPQLWNNIPYIYQMPFPGPTRLRIGAQICQHRNLGHLITKVPQAFFNFLTAHATPGAGFDYVYINLQKRSDGYSQGLLSNERDYEHERSKELHHIETIHPKVAVITLPADNSDFFFKGFDKHHGKPLISGDESVDFQNCRSLFSEIVNSIHTNHHDIFISEAVKNKIFGGATEKHIVDTLQPLFVQTLTEILGNTTPISPTQKLSITQRQAVLFHFFKHHFTDFIIDTLKPQAFNISCKDAIDRAGVHNLWNILCQHMAHDLPLSVEKFETLLNMPAILVKDRPINDHLNVVTNALGHYYYHLPTDKQKLMPWVPEWLNLHSYYHHQSAQAYQWAYTSTSDLSEYRSIHHENYTNLYCAVTEGNLTKVQQILENTPPSKLSYWDGAQQSDTILISAARQGHFQIFKRLMEYHDMKKGYFDGMRSKHPLGQGSALNYLLRHLALDDIDNETTAKSDHELSNLTFDCICHYLKSMVLNSTWSVDFKTYTSQKDEYGMMPIDYLAEIGDCHLLSKIAEFQFKGYSGLYTIKDLFNLRGGETHGKTAMEMAADKGHVDFVALLWKLDQGKNYSRDEFSRAIRIAEAAQSAKLKPLEGVLATLPALSFGTGATASDDTSSRTSETQNPRSSDGDGKKPRF